MIHESTNNVKSMIKRCIYEDNINKKIKLFFKINSLLPKESKIHIPSFITNDYINKVLYKLDEIHSGRMFNDHKVFKDKQNIIRNKNIN
jgi:hypothetical protein